MVPKLPPGVAKPVKRTYGKAMAAALDSVRHATEAQLADPLAGPVVSGRLRRDMTAVRAHLDAAAPGLAADAVGKAEQHGRAYARKRLDGRNDWRANLPTPGAPPRTARWAQDLAQRMNTANGGLLTLPAGVVSQAVTASRLAAEGTGGEAAQHVLDRAADHGLVTISDRRGRRWALRHWAVAATTMAANAAMLDSIVDEYTTAGVALAWFTGPPSEHLGCQQWVGKLIALSGTWGPQTVYVDGELIEVAGSVDEVRATAFHPHCGHGLAPWRIGQTKPPPEPPVTVQQAPKSDQTRAAENLLTKWQDRRRVAVTPAAKSKARRKISEATTAAEQSRAADAR